jgi:uridine phosphorylase
VLRLPLNDESLNEKLRSYQYNDFRITNFEMETSVIYGLSKLLGHEALSLNAIIANRATGAFSKNLQKRSIDSSSMPSIELLISDFL